MSRPRSRKQVPWNDRFWVQNSEKEITRSSSNRRMPKVPNTFEHLRELEKEWEKNDVPIYHRTAFKEHMSTLGPSKASLLVHKELNSLRKSTSIIQLLMKAVESREESMQSIIQLEEFLKNTHDWEKIPQINKECAEVFHAYRIISLNVVESILKWREYLNHKGLEFEVDNSNYLVKMKDDLDLKCSSFTKIFHFQEKSDPFLMAITTSMENKSRNGCILLSSDITKRIYAAEDVINKESNRSISHFKIRIVRDHIDILDSIIKEVTDEFVQEIITTQAFAPIFSNSPVLELSRASFLQDHQISNIFLRQFIEKMLEEADLELLVNSLVESSIETRRVSMTKSTEDLKKIEEISEEINNERLSKLVYKDLIGFFVDSNWLSELSLNVFNLMKDTSALVPEDNTMEMFTPGVHSPMNYSATSLLSTPSSSITGTNIGSVYLDFIPAIEIRALRNLSFQPVGLPDFSIEPVVKEYYGFIPEAYLSFLLPAEALIRQARTGINNSWYWGTLNSRIVGLLVMSETPQGTVEIHHASCSSYPLYKQFLAHMCSFVWDSLLCKEIRICLFEEVPIEVKRSLNELRFKWKTSFQIGKKTACIMALQNPFELEITYIPNLCVNTGCIITLNAYRKTPQYSKDMMEYGNRVSIISLLVNYFNIKTEGNYADLNRLQADLVENIEYSEDFKFPYVDLAPVIDAQNKSYLSSVNISLDILSYNSFYHTIASTVFKYVQFKNGVKKAKDSNLIDLYMVSTNEPSICLFFITYPELIDDLRSDFDHCHADLYYKVQNLLRTCSQFEDFPEISVPQFSKEVSVNSGWIAGFPVSQDLFIESTKHSGKIEFLFKAPSQGILEMKPIRVINQPFIFGAFDIALPRELPIFASLISQENWVNIKTIPQSIY